MFHCKIYKNSPKHFLYHNPIHDQFLTFVKQHDSSPKWKKNKNLENSLVTKDHNNTQKQTLSHKKMIPSHMIKYAFTPLNPN